MSFITVTFESYILGMECTANVILPQSSPSKPVKKPFRTLYLLHGLSDDHSAWSRYSSIERYAKEYGIAVVMPCAHKSFYTNLKNGDRYFDFISDELIGIMEEMFPLSNKREDRFIAGISMGGYGAFKCALTCSDKYTAAASLSGALDVKGLHQRSNEDIKKQFAGMYENYTADTESNDLFILAEKLNNKNCPKPKLYIWCGTEDYLYIDNVKFNEFIQKTDFDVTYEESRGYHVWQYWDMQIKRALEVMCRNCFIG